MKPGSLFYFRKERGVYGGEAYYSDSEFREDV